MNPRSSRTVAILTALVVVLAACGGGDDAPAEPDEPSSPEPGAEEPAAGEWEPEWVDGVLQPLPDGFPSGPLTLLNADDAGSPDGVFARHWQATLQNMAPVDVQLIDRDFGTYGTWAALQWMQEQPGGDDGHMVLVSSIVGGSLDLISEPVVEDLGVSLDDYNFVISTELAPFLLIQKKDPPWGSTDFWDMVEYVRANPGEVNYTCFSPGSGRDISWSYYALTLDLQFREPWACGDGSQGILAIIGSGEGDLGLQSPAEALIGYESDRTDTIMVTGSQPPPDTWPDIPNGTEVTGEDIDPWGVTRGWSVTRDVPDLHRDWLYELFRAAGEDPELIEARRTLPGISLFALDHDESRDLAEAALEFAEPILRELDMYFGD